MARTRNGTVDGDEANEPRWCERPKDMFYAAVGYMMTLNTTPRSLADVAAYLGTSTTTLRGWKGVPCPNVWAPTFNADVANLAARAECYPLQLWTLLSEVQNGPLMPATTDFP